jgi:hypothetical protein
MLWYLDRSPLVQYMVLGHFRTLLNKEKLTIDKDIEEYNQKQETGQMKAADE